MPDWRPQHWPSQTAIKICLKSCEIRCHSAHSPITTSPFRTRMIHKYPAIRLQVFAGDKTFVL